jgi:hypothetical protein
MLRELMRRVLARALAGSLLLASAREARAQQCSNPLISTCINSDTYWPHAGPQRFAAVGSGDTVKTRQIAFGLMTTYLSRPIIVGTPSPGDPGTKHFAIDNQVNTNFLFAYGVTDRLQFDIGVPITLVQNGAGVSPLTGGQRVSDTAVRDMRFGYAWALEPREKPEGLALVHRFTLSAPVGDNNAFAGEPGAVFVPSLAVDYRVWKLFFGGDFGARIRKVTELAGARIGTQITTALGAGFDVLPRDLLSVTLEGRSFINLAEQHESGQSPFGIHSTPNGKWIAPTEWTAGVRSAPVLDGNLSFFLGGGGPIPITNGAVTVPRFRFMLGITYAPVHRVEKRQ